MHSALQCETKPNYILSIVYLHNYMNRYICPGIYVQVCQLDDYGWLIANYFITQLTQSEFVFFCLTTKNIDSFDDS